MRNSPFPFIVINFSHQIYIYIYTLNLVSISPILFRFPIIYYAWGGALLIYMRVNTKRYCEWTCHAYAGRMHKLPLLCVGMVYTNMHFWDLDMHMHLTTKLNVNEIRNSDRERHKFPSHTLDFGHLVCKFNKIQFPLFVFHPSSACSSELFRSFAPYILRFSFGSDFFFHPKFNAVKSFWWRIRVMVLWSISSAISFKRQTCPPLPSAIKRMWYVMCVYDLCIYVWEWVWKAEATVETEQNMSTTAQRTPCRILCQSR